MLFDIPPTLPIPRRTLLGLPIVAGLVAVIYPRERSLPDAAEPGNGPEVQVMLFSSDGKPRGLVQTRSTIRSDSDWHRELMPDEFAITRRNGTEVAFANLYWNCHDSGLYRCVCCGNALFRSQDKFDSGTGWPSFTAPCAQANIQAASDSSQSMQRIEVQCRKCKAHLGHVFDDGPPPSGLRYCVNSAALRLVKYS